MVSVDVEHHAYILIGSFGCWRIQGVGGGLIEIAAALDLRAQGCVKVELDVMG